MMPKGKPHSPELKAKVVMEVLEGDRSLAEVASDHNLNPNLVRKWKNEFAANAARAFSVSKDEADRERELAEHKKEVGDLHRIIGQLTSERDYLQRGILARYGVSLEEVSDRPPSH